jgi:cyclophilin family peptidyl-prolyl cis-trans isomerase
MVLASLLILALPPRLGQPKAVKLVTTKGEIVIHIYPAVLKKTCENFEKLVTAGFYDGLTFHRVEEWVVQGGDPLGDGTGGPGWTIPLESSRRLRHDRGVVGMARNALDVNSGGSQFYVVKEIKRELDGHYAVFGKVVEGLGVVDTLAVGDKIISATMVPLTP